MGGLSMQPDDDKLDKLYSQLEKLHSLLENMTKDGKFFLINIEKIDVQGPVLDELEFIFDKIDVKEVSGALNIGNNFGVSVEGNKENKNVKNSAVNIKKTSEQGEAQTKQNPGSKEAVQKYAEFEKKLEKKLQQIFPKGTKSKENKDQPNKLEKSSRTEKKILPEKELKQPGQLTKIKINNQTILKTNRDNP